MPKALPLPDSTDGPEKALSTLEREVMQLIWSRGPATADAVRGGLEPEKVLKNSTIRTILRRLEAKGFLTHEVAGRTFVYRPLVRRRKAAVQAVRQVIDRFCGGSVEELMLGLVDGDVVSPDQLGELARMIAESEEKEGGAE